MVVKIDKRMENGTLLVDSNNLLIADYMLTIYNGSRAFVIYVPDLPTVKTFLHTFSLREVKLSSNFDLTERDALKAYLGGR